MSDYDGRPSKIDDYRHLVGVLPDKEVAEQAGLTAEAVRTWRLRRGIPAAWRGETEAQAPPKAPARRRTPRKKAKKARPSVLGPYLDRLGVVPDKEIAKLAGTSAENVRVYRLRRGIPAGWRGEGAPEVAPEPVEAPAVEAPRPVAPAPRAPEAPFRARRPRVASGAPGRRMAYRVVADVAGEERTWILFGAEMAEALVDGAAALEAMHPGARLRSVEVVGEAL